MAELTMEEIKKNIGMIKKFTQKNGDSFQGLLYEELRMDCYSQYTQSEYKILTINGDVINFRGLNFGSTIIEMSNTRGINPSSRKELELFYNTIKERNSLLKKWADLTPKKEKHLEKTKKNSGLMSVSDFQDEVLKQVESKVDYGKGFVNIRFNKNEAGYLSYIHICKDIDIEKWAKRSYIDYEYDHSPMLDTDSKDYKKELALYKNEFLNPTSDKCFEVAYVRNELSIGDKDSLGFMGQSQLNCKKPIALIKDNVKVVAAAIIKAF